jgi:hypothetical protein
MGPGTDDVEPEEYLDPNEIPEAAKILDDCVRNVGELTAARNNYDLQSGDLIPTSKARLKQVLWYWHQTTMEPYGAELAPVFSGGLRWPQPPAETPQAVRKFWNGLAPLLTEPLSIALVRDLCFTVRIEAVGEHGGGAIDSYLKAAKDPNFDRVDASNFLLRAWTIARSMKDDARQLRIVSEVESMIEAPDSPPGVVVCMLKLLCELRPTAPIAKLVGAKNRLLESCLSRYAGSPLQFELAELTYKHHGDVVTRDSAAKLIVTLHLDKAAAAENVFAKQSHLQAAAQFARDQGFQDLENRARTELQQVAAIDSDWSKIQAKMTLPAELVESMVRPFERASNSCAAIHHFLSTDPPSGDFARNTLSATRSVSQPLLFNAIGIGRIGSHGLPVAEVATKDERVRSELVRTETMWMGLSGVFLAAGLQRIPESFGLPTLDELVSCLVNAYGSEQRVTRNFAKALLLFWQHENEACVHLAVPIVERVCRELLIELNSPIFRVAKGFEIGQYPGLGQLLPSLVEKGFDESWERFLSTLLTSEGRNIRNDVAHGLIGSVSDSDAALVLRAAGHMLALSGEGRQNIERAPKFPNDAERKVRWSRISKRLYLLRLLRTKDRS